ncbi:MAG: Tim44/TimA family putative adaptor protein [Proteobacteria bacterium]|nr:Tim44/TimA family putative adaptor protein [Pseudomonadota bacterium]
MGEGFQFIDIILFAMVAAFIILRLRSVLGRRHDQGKPRQQDPFSVEPPKNRDDNVVQLPDPNDSRDKDRFDTDTLEPVEPAEPDSPLQAGVAQIQAASPGFDLKEFAAGAGGAFEMIVEAFAKGDRATLESLLSETVFDNFTRAISAREEAKETLENTLVGIRSLTGIEAYMEGKVAHVTVKIVSEQVNITRDADGEVVDGDPNHITEITDIWTFARDTSSRDPNWELVATRSLD